MSDPAARPGGDPAAAPAEAVAAPFIQADPDAAPTDAPRDRSRLYGALMLLISCGALFGALAANLQDFRTMRAKAQDRLERIVEGAALRVGAEVGATLRLSSLALQGVADDWIDDPDAFAARHQRTIASITATLETVDFIVILDARGRIQWFRSPKIIGHDRSDRAYFAAAMRGEVFFGDPLTARMTRKRVMPLAAPMRDADGRIRGVLAIALQTETFAAAFAQLLAESGASVTLLSSTGEAFISLGGDETPVSEQDRAGHGTRAELLAALALGPDLRWTARTAVPESPYEVVAVHSAAHAAADWRRTAQQRLLFALALAALALSSWRVVKRSEAALREKIRLAGAALFAARQSHAAIDALLASVGDGVVISDDAGGVLRATPPALELLRARDPEQALPRLSRAFPELGKMGRAAQADFPPRPLTVRGGATRDVACSAHQVFLHGRVLRLCILRDASNASRIERNRAEFIGAIQHEIRSPLQAIIGGIRMLRTLLGQDAGEKPARVLDISDRNAQRLLNLVNDLLMLHTIDEVGLTVELRPTPLRAALAEAVESMAGYAGGLGVTLRLDPGAAEASALVDAERLQQILANLVSNAAKYTPEGAAVELSVQASDRDATISVADPGPGIPLHLRPVLFERFSRERGAADERRPSTGLGLAITRQLVEAMNGTIAFETRTRDEAAQGATGTVFRVTFPRAREAAGDAAPGALAPSA
ncbi:ATP-binding protein [Rhodovulum sp. DZ06]|uniref:cache domain-containing sensor histidine kinase n=1 Tax=Rhodovulum sp. DZ06 TaxID=3425126 RepID=UPI003D34CC9C